MHSTDNIHIKGHVDRKVVDTDSVIISGWSFSESGQILPLRAVSVGGDGNITELENSVETDIAREDVSDFYKDNGVTNCGWTIQANVKTPIELQANLDNEWVTVFHFRLNGPADLSVNNFYPTVIVVDNFYKNPYSVREFALEQTFNLHPKLHKGRRTEECFKFDLKEKFELIMGCKIINWDKYGMNGRFQYCIAGDQLVYHADHQEYAAIIYLNPDAPPETGTSFYRSKYTQRMKFDNDEYSTVFRNGHLDSTDFELVDTVGNVFNRLVIFDGQLLHAAAGYNGTNAKNGRLFHIFFFDIQRD